MTWPLWITLIIAFLKPILPKWLQDLLNGIQVQGKLPEMHDDPAVAVADIFTAARRELWWWQAGRRKLLDVAQRAVLARAQQLAGIAKTGSVVVPVMTVAEYDALVNSI